MTKKGYIYESPTLYASSESGKIKVWFIGVRQDGNNFAIVTEAGYENGKMQTHTDIIKSGKNHGKANETSIAEQAKKEAFSKWEGKKKKGYVESIKSARAGEVDSIITGGIEPMLAHTYSKSSDKIKYPAWVQPKLDGQRCIAIKKSNSVTLWSRTRKPITSCPHIVKAIAEQWKGENIVLDGELYNHDYAKDFETLSSGIRTSKPSEKSELVQYHVYDVISAGSYSLRFGNFLLGRTFIKPIIDVETVHILNEASMFKQFEKFVADGYEGLIIRNLDGEYEGKRSYNLQKVKEFDDAEFKIIGVNEGRGKLQGKLGTFTCVTKSGDEFEVKMTGDEDENTKYLKNSKLWRGKMLTVKYQGLTNKNNVPRFPVGLRIRGAE